MNSKTRIPHELRSEMVQEATKMLAAYLGSNEYSAGNSIVPIRHARQQIISDGKLIQRLRESRIRGRVARDLRTIVEEAANQLGYQRQPLVVTRQYPIEGVIADERNSQYWVKRAA